MSDLIRNLYCPLILLMLSLISTAVSSATISGHVTDRNGIGIDGAIITLTSSDGLTTHSAYSNNEGRFSFQSDLTGAVSIRSRKPDYRDSTRQVELHMEDSVTVDFTMYGLSSVREISENLPASAHFSRLEFSNPVKQQWFKVDCLTCHQVGNLYTRAPRPPQRWNEILTRMLGFYGVTDEKKITEYSQILSSAFDGSDIDIKQAHQTDPVLSHARIFQWKLPQGYIAHDVEYNENDGKFYTVDQGRDLIYITDPATDITETFTIPDGGIPQGGKFKRLLGLSEPYSLTVSRGPHSLQQGPDGNYYTTDTISGQIGEFNPETRSYIGHEIGGNALYPHTLRFDKRGRVWFTISASNQVGVFDTKTGAMQVTDLPDDTDRPHVPALYPYGIDIHPIDGSVWYSSLMANRIGRIDPDTFELDVFKPPLVGPRRLRFGKDGTLWIPAFGSGALVKLKTNSMEYTTYAIPALSEDESEAPYALGIHPESQEVWITANMSDRMFRFLPGEERFIAYPLPTRGIYLRDIIFTSHGWICAASSPVPPLQSVEGGMQEILCLEPDASDKQAAGHQLP